MRWIKALCSKCCKGFFAILVTLAFLQSGNPTAARETADGSIRPKVSPASRKGVLISPAFFSKMKLESKRRYISAIRKTWYQLEVKMKAPKNRKYSFFSEILQEGAYAASGKCLAGGVVTRKVGGKCQIGGRPCNGDSSMYTCGVIYGNACVSIKTKAEVDSLSVNCEKAGRTKRLDDPENYKKLDAEYEAGLDEVCPLESRPDPRCTEARSALKRSLQIAKGENPEIPENLEDAEPPPSTALIPRFKPIPPKESEERSSNYGSNCDPNRNQGFLGVCHSFCLTCTYDTLVRQKANNGDPAKEFRTSEQWMTMISVTERLCDGLPEKGETGEDIRRQCRENNFQRQVNLKLTPKILSEGADPARNANLLSKIGACDAGTYHDYPSTLTQDTVLSEIPTEKASPLGRTRSADPRLAIVPDTKLEGLFGVRDRSTLFSLFCPTPCEGTESFTRENYKEKLDLYFAGGQISEKFYNCAKQSLTVADGLGTPTSPNKCVSNSLEGLNPEQRYQKVRNTLSETEVPFPIVIGVGLNKDKVPVPTANKKAQHCVSASENLSNGIGTVNSWGDDLKKNSNIATLKRTDSKSLLFYTDISCLAPSRANRTPAGVGGSNTNR